MSEAPRSPPPDAPRRSPGRPPLPTPRPNPPPTPTPPRRAHRLPVAKAGAGNLVLVEGLDAAISKTATVFPPRALTPRTCTSSGRCASRRAGLGGGSRIRTGAWGWLGARLGAAHLAPALEPLGQTQPPPPPPPPPQRGQDRDGAAEPLGSAQGGGGPAAREQVLLVATKARRRVCCCLLVFVRARFSAACAWRAPRRPLAPPPCPPQTPPPPPPTPPHLRWRSLGSTRSWARASCTSTR